MSHKRVPSRPLTILTGASRGLGAALAEQLAAAGHDLLCVSRRTHPALERFAAEGGATVEQWEHDLAQGDVVADRLMTWLPARRDGASSVTLINNAALLPGIAPLVDIPGADLSRSMRVNLEAPMLLTSAFLVATADWSCSRKVLNISSGLGRRAMAAQTTYCAAKAGLDHFTRCLALEQAMEANGARVCSLAPGVVDTGMQQELRAAAARLSDAGSYADLHRPRQLSAPADTAAQILAFLASPDFGREPVADMSG